MSERDELEQLRRFRWRIICGSVLAKQRSVWAFQGLPAVALRCDGILIIYGYAG